MDADANSETTYMLQSEQSIYIKVVSELVGGEFFGPKRRGKYKRALISDPPCIL